MRIFIYGAGAQGRVINDILASRNIYKRIEFIDDNRKFWGKKINNTLVIGGLKYIEKQNSKKINVIIALGNPLNRLALAKKLKAQKITLLNAIHPSAVIAKTVIMGEGNMIGANVVINSNTIIGNNTIINTSSIIEHDCYVEDGANISSGSNLCGRVTVNRGAFICSGAIILPRLTIGQFSVVAAGSLVTKNVENKVMVKGFPAKKVQTINKNFNWKRLL